LVTTDRSAWVLMDDLRVLWGDEDGESSLAVVGMRSGCGNDKRVVQWIVGCDRA